MMKTVKCRFQNFEICLLGQNRRYAGISRAGRALSEIIPSLTNRNVIDLGCGVGYMTIGALRLSARKVIALDLLDTKKILFQNIRTNRFNTKMVQFMKSDLFSALHGKIKFDVIIANLPQHALPATPLAKKLMGKYGGHDGTDLVCRALTEGARYLKNKGSYFGSVSRLTNFNRTMAIGNSLYKIKVHKTITKTLETNEMAPYLNNIEVFKHLKTLMKQGLIEFSINKYNQIEYRVHLCEFVLNSK